ncbi:DUF2510 domain-containing protein [Nonomuraea sp. NPDC049758]|uniref:DUF2510 domain-containing protein n=1 Tax=Nonomuraea sp. NPDC049758 TaxID=3154360 RepID=UPI00343A5602
MTTQTPAGWYPDPYGEPQLRWWDGNQWTDATHAQERQPQPQQPSSGPQPQSSPDWSATPANPTLRYGRPSSGQPPYGQPADQPPYGQPADQQPAQGQPPYGGQPAQGLPAYGQPTRQQPAFGQQPTQQPTQWAGGPLPGPGQAPPPKQGNPLPWVFGGLAALVVVALIVVAGIFFLNRGGSTPVASPTTEEPQPFPTAEPPSAGPPTELPPQGGELPQPQDGRITDPRSGLSYQAPDGWKVPAYGDVNGTDPSQQMWTSGVQASSQENYEGDKDWIGNAYAGPLAALIPYTGASALEDTAKALFMQFSTQFYEPQHTTKLIENKATKIGDHDAWVMQFQLDFTAVAEKNGYKWKKENAAIVLMDRGAGQRPTLLYISVPDNLGTDVVAKVLGSLKPA